jgi:N-acetylglutamate synthase-like GNAT family acetyltransferase
MFPASNNLSFGFLSSESAKIFDEIAPVSSKGIAEGTISEKKQGQDHEKIADSERIKPKTQVIIATLGDEIVGCAEFEPNGHIDCFYCHHEWIGKGVGSALMKEIFHIAKNNHIHHIFSEVSITAKPFFAKHGFKVVTEQTIVRKGVELTNFKMERTL